MAVREALRVSGADGDFRCLEHGCSNNRVVAAGQRALDPLARRFEADNLCREPDVMVLQAGGRILTADRSRAGIVWRIKAIRSSASGAAS